MNHLLVLSYFSHEEVERYRVLAEVLAGWPRPAGFTVTALLCSVSTGIEASAELEAAFARVMPTRTYRCQTTVTGYPARPTAMFWEIMEHVASTDERDGGFALWFEADMVPTRPTWLSELHAAWTRTASPLIMGRVNLPMYLVGRGVIGQHVNGGACYAKRYGRTIPKHLKQGTFDLSPWQYLAHAPGTVATELFAFGTLARLPAELADSRAAVLHAYRQDKPRFYAEWAERIRGRTPTGGTPPARCCDLHTRHLGVTYCPLHDKLEGPARLANAVSVAVMGPPQRWRRRLRWLRKAVRV